MSPLCPRLARLSVLLTILVLLAFGCMVQQKGKRPMPVSKKAFTFSCHPDHLAALRPEVRQAFCLVAEAYYQASGEKLHLTSAKRSLRHCAELMAGFTREQLEGMYCRNGYPDYIRSIVQAQQRQNTALSTEQIYQILQKRQGGYISWHLIGAAVDISANVKDPALLRKLLQEQNFCVFDEQVFGISCLHATYRGLTPEIIRE